MCEKGTRADNTSGGKTEGKENTMRLTKKALTDTKDTVLILAIVALTLVSGSTVLAAPPDRDVIVVNTPAQPVPVTGTVAVTGATTVSGTVNAAQSGPWTVGIDPAHNLVSLAPGGSLFDNPGFAIIGSAPASIDLGPFDLSDLSKLRIIVRAFNNNGGDIKFTVFAWDPNPVFRIPLDEFSLNEEGLSRVYDVPPPTVVVRVTKVSGTAANYHVVVIGR
jgi:hypothetical protein